MNAVKPIDVAEKWLAKHFLDPAEYNIFLRDPISLRNEIKKRIFCEIRKLISISGQTKPPFAPEKIAHYRKINSVVGDETLRHREAILTQKDDGFIIKFNPTKPRVRVRFSLAHEIGHTYFFDLNTNPPQKFYSVMSSRYWVEEGYACEIAREILAPEPYVSAITTQICKYPSIHALIRLQKVFDVSYDVLIKRLLYDSHLWNANFWGNNLWNAIIMTANVSATDDDVTNLKVHRSPTYKYKFKDIKDLRKIVSRILKNNAPVYDVIIKRKNKYKVEGTLIERVNPMVILIAFNDDRRV